jgi:putative colanic acid biosynthesis acetyltransferase WcaF
MSISPDISSNRSARKYSRAELAGRVLWGAANPLFRWSPRLLWGWRNMILRIFGAKIGRDVQIHPTARIFLPWNLVIGDWSSIGFDTLVYNLGPVTIGSRVTISQRAHLCAGSHDHRDSSMTLLKPPISIGDGAWICADAFVGPGVAVGDGAVVGARAVVMSDVAPRSVMVGNPSRKSGSR